MSMYYLYAAIVMIGLTGAFYQEGIMSMYYLYAAIVMIVLAGAFYLGYRYGATVVQDVSKAASTVEKVL